MFQKIIEDVVQRYSSKRAIIYGQRSITFKALAKKINSYRHFLLEAKIGEADCIVVLLPNCPEFIISFYAIAQCRAICFPLNPDLSAHELKRYLKDCQVRSIITEKARLALCQETIALLAQPIKLLVVEELAATENAAPELPTEVQGSERTLYEGDVLYQCSSGSTGRPKRVVRTQKNLIAEGKIFAHTVALTSADTILCAVPLFHAYGLGCCMLAAMQSGATLVILEPAMEDGRIVNLPFAARCPEVLALMKREAVTIFPGVPFMFEALSHVPFPIQEYMLTLRCCFSAGNFVSKDIFDLFYQKAGMPIRSLYGNTEAGVVSLNMEDAALVTHDSTGLSANSVEVLVVGEDSCAMPPQKVGEIILKSLALTRGYDQDDELNAKVFKNGYFFTGDLGFKDANEHIYITGRKKIFIDAGGYKVDPLEIEHVLCSHASVAEAVVVGVAMPQGGEMIKAVVVCNGDCSEQELLRYCRAQLAEFKLPQMIEFRTHIPKSPLGKILRKDLLQTEDLPDRTHDARSAVLSGFFALTQREQKYLYIEKYLQTKIAKLLGLEPQQVGSDQPLGSFGLNSVTSVELSNQLTEELRTKFSAVLLWSYPTLKQLAEYIVERLASPSTLSEETLRRQAVTVPPTDDAFEQSTVQELRARMAQQMERLLGGNPEEAAPE